MGSGDDQLGDTLVVSAVAGTSPKDFPLAPVPQNVSYETISLQPPAEPNQPVSVPISFHGGLAYDQYDPETGGCLINTGILCNERGVLRAPVKVNTTTLTDAAAPPMYFFEEKAPNATIAFDAASDANDASAEDITWAHTVGSGSNRVLFVGLSLNGDNYASGVTYGGIAMTRVQLTAGTNCSTDSWVLVNPTSGANNVIATLNAAGDIQVGAMSFTGVDQATPTGSSVGSGGESDSPSKTAITATGEVVVDVLACGNQTATVGANQTQKWNDIQGATVRGAGSYQAGSDGGVMSWSLGASTIWILTAVTLKPSNTPVLYANSVEDGEVNSYKVSLDDSNFGDLLKTKTWSGVTTKPMGRPAQWTSTHDGTYWRQPLGDNILMDSLTAVAAGTDADTWSGGTDAYARHLLVVKDQLYRTHGDNEVDILDNDQDPETDSGWGGHHKVGDASAKITDIAQVAGLCSITAEDGVWEFDGVADAANILPELGKAERNGQGLSFGRGGFFYPGVASLYWGLTGQPIGPDSFDDRHAANDPSLGAAAYFKHGRWNGTTSYNGHFYGIYVDSTGTSAYVVWAYPVGERWRWQAIASVTADFNDFHGIHVAETSKFSASEVRPCLFFANGTNLSWIWLDKNGAPMLRRGDIDLHTAAAVISGRMDFGFPRVPKQLTYVSGWAEDMAAPADHHTFWLTAYRDGGAAETFGSITGDGDSPDGYFTKYWTQDTQDECRSLLLNVGFVGTNSLTDQNGPLLRDVQIHAILKPATTRLWGFLISAKDDTSRTAKTIRSDLEGYMNDLKLFKFPHGDAFGGMLTNLQLLRADEINALTPRGQSPPKFVFRATVREMPAS